MKYKLFKLFSISLPLYFKAICYNTKEEYSLLEKDSDIYIVASKLSGDVQVSRALPGARLVGRVLGSDLHGAQYTHPLYPAESRPFLPGVHVTTSSGTGLVHTAPAHGQDDFKSVASEGYISLYKLKFFINFQTH